MIDPAEGNARRGVVEWLWGFVRSENTGGVFYGWRLVVIGFLILLVGREIGDGLIIGSVWGNRAVDHGGIGPPWIVLAIAGGVIGGLASLWFAGRGVDRLGPRRMARIGLPLVGPLVMLSALPVPGAVEAAFSGLAVLSLIGAYVPAITMLNHWFRNRLTVALSLLLFGVAVGGVVVDWLLALLSSDVFVGWWRDGFGSWWPVVPVACGLAITVAAWPLARAMRDRPEDWGEHPDGLAPVAAENVPNYSWREAVRSRQFWTLMAAGGCVAVASSVASVYDGPVIAQGSGTFEDVDRFGLFEKFASVAGILAGGLASYRFPVKYVLSGTAIVQAVGIAVLLSGYGPALLEAAILLGAASGMATAPAIAVVGIYFGRRSFGMITVTAMLINYLASVTAVPAAGYLGYPDPVPGMYTAIFLVAAIVSVVGAGLYLVVGQPRLSPSQQVENPAIS